MSSQPPSLANFLLIFGFITALVVSGTSNRPPLHITKCHSPTNALFTLVLEEKDFISALLACEADGFGTLGRVSSLEEHGAVVELMAEAGSSFSGNFYIGVYEAGPRAGTGNFVFVDGSVEGLDFIRTAQGSFPWAREGASEPNSDGTENCVNWDRVRGNRWNDVECDRLRPYLCRRNCITSAPSTSPDSEADEEEEEVQLEGESESGLFTVLFLLLIALIASVAANILLYFRARPMREVEDAVEV